MQITSTSIPEVLLLECRKFEDTRGFFAETFRQSVLVEAGFERSFVQENHSYSKKKGVLRGLHFQSGSKAQDKLVRCTRGGILDVAIDIRIGSPTYGQHVAVELSAENCRQLLVPIGFAHGFITLEPKCEVQYKTSNYYSAEHDKGLAYDDPALGIDWKLAPGYVPELSEKDQNQPKLLQLPRYFVYKGAGYDYGIEAEC